MSEKQILQIRRISTMVYPPKEPNGWFLLRAEHTHNRIIFKGDTHKPLPYAHGPWLVEFQKYPTGGFATQGRGHNLLEAWHNAVVSILEAERLSKADG